MALSFCLIGEDDGQKAFVVCAQAHALPLVAEFSGGKPAFPHAGAALGCSLRSIARGTDSCYRDA